MKTFIVTLGLLILGTTLPLSAQPLTLNRNFRPDPIRLEGRTGGSVNLSSLAAGCRGFASSQANHVLVLRENFPVLDLLAYSTNVNTDLTMLVKGDNGLVLCADDENQRRNPQVSRRLTQGTYQIWVGSNELGRVSQYSLSVSESPQR